MISDGFILIFFNILFFERKGKKQLFWFFKRWLLCWQKPNVLFERWVLSLQRTVSYKNSSGLLSTYNSVYDCCLICKFHFVLAIKPLLFLYIVGGMCFISISLIHYFLHLLQSHFYQKYIG